MAYLNRYLFWSLCFALVCISVPLVAQQQLGTITGTVSDSSGAVIARSNVDLVNNDTGFKKTAVTKEDGTFFFADLPIGTYTLTFNQTGFKKEVHDRVLVQANRTFTVNVKLQPGATDTTVEVNGTPLLNSVDTTNGYVLNSQQIEDTPLGTGSFTQLAVLSPGVSADFLGGTGTNTGLGNQAIWANGQRDTSNTFTINSVSVNNIFNGKSSSQVTGNRNVLNTGENFLNGGATIQTNTSVYDAVGQGLPSPPPETIQELRVNTSMYDTTQGATSGAQINVQTRSGTNLMHGQVYGYRDFGALDANNFFNNNAENGTITNPVTGAPAPIAQPPIHRGIVGATVGGPVIKDKLFFFASYQYATVSDTLGGLGAVQVNVPTALSSDRSSAGLQAVATALNGGTPVTLNPVAVTLLQFKLPNGQFLIPSAQNSGALGGADSSVLSPASTFTAHQANGNLDYNLSQKDQLFLKTYWQVDPTSTPFTPRNNLLGFPQQLLAQGDTASLQNVIAVSPSMSWDQKIGFVREKVFSTAGQPLTASAAGINVFGSQQFPGINIHAIADPNAPSLGGLEFGPNSNFANTGVAQNQLELSSNLTWVKGEHTFQFGGNFDHSQLNIINLANQVGFVGFNNFLDFLTGNVATTGRNASEIFTGSTSRYYRGNQVGMYASDKIRLTKTLNLTAGLRYDWDGPLSELNGNLINFDPTKYQFNATTDTIVNDGLVVAGNNPQFATPGASNSTITGRQWGIAPRLGLAWSPSFLKEKVVIRAGWGMYYDRGEFFTEFSPTAGGGINGPFGATLQPPSVVLTQAPSGATFQNPFGTTAPPAGETPQTFANSLPNLAQLLNGNQPFEFGGYDPHNKLPYSENWNLDIQWQPVNDWVVTAAYIGNHGVHEVEPIPFNQPGIATPQHPINGETSSYGFNVVASETANTFDGGNTDLRVPFVGFSPNSVLYQANGISNYNAAQLQITKRFSHGFMINTSYTYSHSLDEGSALGLFFNGNNALNLGQNYANSDFDRTHVVTINYIYQVPKFASFHGLADKFLNGWGIAGITTFQSGQPYSVIDFSGAEGSIFYGSNDFITNPIVPLAPGFSPQTAGNGQGGLNPNAFAPQFLQPGQDGVPAGDTLESAFSNNGRNLFRGPFQKRGDISIFKDTSITERVHLKYALNILNVTNTPSFDTPNNNVSFNNGFNNPPSFFSSGSAAAAGSGFGLIQNTLGSPRIIQMSMHVTF